jgi:hypothetical protein
MDQRKHRNGRDLFAIQDPLEPRPVSGWVSVCKQTPVMVMEIGCTQVIGFCGMINFRDRHAPGVVLWRIAHHTESTMFPSHRPQRCMSFYPAPGEPGGLEALDSEHELSAQAGSSSSPTTGSPKDLLHSLVQKASFANQVYESAIICAYPLYSARALRRLRISLGS